MQYIKYKVGIIFLIICVVIVCLREIIDAMLIYRAQGLSLRESLKYAIKDLFKN
jgi:hypothetical protein